MNEYEEVYQDDPQFAPMPIIKKAGCFVCSIYKFGFIYFDVKYAHEDIMSFVRREWDDGDMDVDEEMLVGDAQDLIDDLVGKGRVLYKWKQPLSYELGISEVAWGVWHAPGGPETHFVLAEKPNIQRVAYDPIRGGSRSVREGKLIGLRVAEIVKPLKG